ncbi:M48 family metallopeptidase [Marichromatium bheemlicum]|uniref:M48 family metallopeptidase n=1 Tax=Marichromatium bheemlicum TaxID=365339 RepID=A0ABX1I8P4_9GAMM|nr:M48 family metallopeptidase [Marichromatium bheemlicum]NKN33556.1 M48 family metallopeptidase [Marichromatium bheemlicum]
MSVFTTMRWLLPGCLLPLLWGCVSAPETGRSQLMLIDHAEEARLGARGFEQIKRKLPRARDRAAQARVERIGRRIARVVDLPEAQWEFVLFADDTPNAFALPGGKVGVNTGILPITRNDAGLATVMAHEIAHVMARHSAEQRSQEMLAEIGAGVLSAVLGARGVPNSDLAVRAYGVGAQLGVMLPYSRAHELEADRLGLIYMARAGYDPREAIAFWQRFEAANRGGRAPPAFLSTHPLDGARIEQLRALLPEAEAIYARARR